MTDLHEAYKALKERNPLLAAHSTRSDLERLLYDPQFEAEAYGVMMVNRAMGIDPDEKKEVKPTPEVRNEDDAPDYI